MKIFDDGTDAAIFLTIYPNSINVEDKDIQALATQCQSITNTTGRNLFIRFAPEMNGHWFPYSGDTAAYIALWRKVYTAINAVAPTVAMVWSPNTDTSDGQFPYAPYWPGEDYVDWVGLSLYWKGYENNYPLSFMVNSLCPSDYTAQMMDSQGPQGSKTSFYQEYAVKYNKPFVISEGGGAFQIAKSLNGVRSEIDAGPGRTAMVMSFWSSNIFNPAFLAKYPKFKMAISFEIWKKEAEQAYMTERDFRIIGDDATAAAFHSEIQKLDTAGVVIWGQKPKPTTTTTTAVAAVSPTFSIVVTQVPPNKNVATEKTSNSSTKNIVSAMLLLFITLLLKEMIHN
ncbi:glycoside hydrolase [Rhizoclosmatium globosum]|uniref:Glycoside hydrolase n=1 Tax=Rhizoclosmatium globosum TaxID=329046 RepID=A0A1Y2BZ31_9FUNG|nr:glycoside hydrolase [Rhizoclosmatium globosum]|eukprot:ORY39986.1 glycoside hydrolase [Rhizoclosmatium globosum]